MHLAALPVVLPLMTAAILAGVGSFLPRRALDLTALAASGAVLAICIALIIDSSHGVIVYWFGGWQPTPSSHFPVGICFMIDPFGAGLAAFTALLVLAAFTFSWSYFESVKALYHVLMLAFLAAMCGLALTGDLFNLFVWFELMTAAGVALCGYKSEESQPLQGALNFAVTNTVAAFLSLTGVALLYASTGSLNMAEVGKTLAANPPGESFLAVAFLFTIAGFLVKSASFPFHFWLADAHAVAPTPVCVLFSGVMVELGLYAVARIYWIVFAPSGHPAVHAMHTVFLLMGSLAAIVGALYCFGQRHLKRLLAFSTISHAGLMLLGFALLDPRALAGMALYLLGHGMVKASLFIGAGILLHRLESVDEYDIGSAARRMWPVGVMMAMAAWGLAGLPPFANSLGEDLIDRSSAAQHLGWLAWIAVFAEALTAAAVLRFTSRVFFGWGNGKSITSEGAPHIHMEVETRGQHNRVPAFMWAPMAALLAVAMLIALPLRGRVDRFAAQFESTPVYQAAVLQDGTPPPPPLDQHDSKRPAPASFWWMRLLTAAAMLAAAASSLFPGTRAAKPLGIGFLTLLKQVRTFQSGRVGDYVAWFAFGIAAYGGLPLLFR